MLKFTVEVKVIADMPESEEMQKTFMKNAEDVINSVVAYIKSARGIKSSKMLDIPVAVVLTKFDTILNHRAFGPQALIKNSSLTVRNDKVDLAEIKQVDSEIRYWLEQIGEKTSVNLFSRF